MLRELSPVSTQPLKALPLSVFTKRTRASIHRLYSEPECGRRRGLAKRAERKNHSDSWPYQHLSRHPRDSDQLEGSGRFGVIKMGLSGFCLLASHLARSLNNSPSPGVSKSK
jgi:hypothetical protein